MIQVTVNSSGVQRWIGAKGEVIYRGLFRAMTQEMFKLARYVREEKLSGQVLNNKTGTLRRAVFARTTEDAGAITGSVAVDPSVPYARIHEYGGKIKIPAVRGKLMVFEAGGATVFTMRRRAFTVTMPQRSYLRSSLAELRADIVANLKEAIQQAVGGM